MLCYTLDTCLRFYFEDRRYKCTIFLGQQYLKILSAKKLAPAGCVIPH